MAAKKDNSTSVVSINTSNIYVTERQTLADVLKNVTIQGGFEKAERIIYENQTYKHTRKNKCGSCKLMTNSDDGITIYEINKVKVVDKCIDCNNQKIHEVDINNLDENIKSTIFKKKKPMSR